MSKELKIKGALSKDYQQLYVDDEPTGIEINSDGKVRIKNLVVTKDVAENLVVDGGLRLTYDDNDYFDISSPDQNGVTTIQTVDSDSYTGTLNITSDGQMNLTSFSSNLGLTCANLNIDASADVTLDVDGGNVNINDDDVKVAEFLSSGGGQLILYDDADDGDYLRLQVQASGASNITTVDDGGETAHLSLVPDGDLTLNPKTGNFIAMKDSTEFSVANSAFAGMIIGYRMIGEDASDDSYALTTSMAVPDSAMTVRFVAPPSGAVEVMVQVFTDITGTRKRIHFGLSDNATYNSIGDSYEHIVYTTASADDDEVVQNYWTITGLTAGTTYNYWFGAKTTGIVHTLRWGGTAAGKYPDFIMKVTALPNATADFAVYD